jgi:hypothetical protein
MRSSYCVSFIYIFCSFLSNSPLSGSWNWEKRGNLLSDLSLWTSPLDKQDDNFDTSATIRMWTCFSCCSSKHARLFRVGSVMGSSLRPRRSLLWVYIITLALWLRAVSVRGILNKHGIVRCSDRGASVWSLTCSNAAPRTHRQQRSLLSTGVLSAAGASVCMASGFGTTPHRMFKFFKSFDEFSFAISRNNNFLRRF